jgi:hypothetical protein
MAAAEATAGIRSREAAIGSWRARGVSALRAGILLAALALALSASISHRASGPSARAGNSRVPQRFLLSPGLAAAASARIGASERAFWPARDGSSLLTAGGGIHTTFTATGETLRVPGGAVALSLAAVARGGRVDPVVPVAPGRSQDTVLYRHRAILESYRNGPYGLEQSFTIPRRIGGSGTLGLVLAVRGSLAARQAGSEVLFSAGAGAPSLRYGQLSAFDASGRRLSSAIWLHDGTLRLRIDDEHARYPIRIDPFIQQGSKLTGAGETFKGFFGATAALSADGNTALIGGFEDNNRDGAAWVFVRSGSTWTQQGAKLTGGEKGLGPLFGTSVALSADGNTAVVGAERDNANHGDAWVFTRSGSTWTLQEELNPNDVAGAADAGSGVALSADGNTALVGGLGDNNQSGAAWVFTRSGGTWTQQGSKLAVGAFEQFGTAVALSMNGNTALISGRADSGQIGAAWVFTRSGSTWTQQGPKLTGAGEVGGGEFGTGIALSADGNTALIGAVDDNSAGAAFVFARAGTTWTQQGAKLTPEVGTGNLGFGGSVALSADGNTALVGGIKGTGGGAAWVFTRSGSEWIQQGPKFGGSGEIGSSGFGWGVALSGDANTALIGGAQDHGNIGAAWVFVAVPTVSSVSPALGPATGGTTVTIAGTNFQDTTAVTFGSTNATSYSVNPAGTAITAEAPPGAGTVDVRVTTAAGTNTAGTADRFTYATNPSVESISPATGPGSGGTSVTITGTNLTAASAVDFGSTASTSFSVSPSGTSITAESPAGSGTVDVTVVTPGGTSPMTAADQFVYVPAPSITAVDPEAGPVAGGTSVAISGTGLAGATAVSFGSTAAGSFSVNPEGTEILAESPAGAGTVDVTVTTLGGTSATTAADRFSYFAVPVVAGLSPAAGPETGGTTVTITGTDLGGATEARFGSASASNLSVNAAGTVATVLAPSGTGTVDVTLTTPGGTSASSAADRFAYVPAPAVEGISPGNGPESGGTLVTITGTNLAEDPTVRFGSTPAATVVVNSPTSLTAESPLGTGTVDVTVGTLGGTSPATVADQFSYIPEPVVTGVSPAAGPSGGGTTVTITGMNLTGASAVSFGATPAGSYLANPGGTAITAEAPGGTGTVDVTVATAGGTSATGPGDQFSYVQPPAVTGVSPTAGPVAGGTSVTITGTNLAGASEVSFADKAALSFTVNAGGSSITAFSPAGTGTVEVTVTTIGGTSTTSPADQFSYFPPPSVSKVSPASGPAAGSTVVTISGTNLTGATAVRFGAANAAGVSVNPAGTSITAISPPGTATVNVTVTTAGGTSATNSADQFTYLPPPTVTKLKPGSGPAAGGTVVTITGTNFTGASAVRFGANGTTVFSVNPGGTAITVVAPPGAGTVDVSVTAPGGVSLATVADRFEYAPTVTQVSPGAGPAAGGTPVTVTGTGFLNVTAIKFGSHAVALTSINATGTEIKTTAPAGTNTPATNSVDVTVSAPAGASPINAADQFSYAPTVNRIKPSAGQATGGTVVTITGANLSGVTSVNFAGTSGSGLSVNATGTELTVKSPPGTGTVDVRAISQAGASPIVAADQFSYFPPPSVTKVKPNTGPGGGGTAVTITGTNLVGATAVMFGSKPSLGFAVNAAGTSISAGAPPGSGIVDVTVSTPGGTSPPSAADQFSYLPSVTKVSPSSGPAAGGTIVTITGTNLTETRAVSFAGHTVSTGFTVNGTGTAVTLAAPAGAGAVDVTVGTTGGTSATSAADRFSYAPTVTSVSPAFGPAAGGGSPVTITGTGFTGATAVKFGSHAAAGFTVNAGGTAITLSPPAGTNATGTSSVDLTVTAPAGTSPLSAADRFSYAPTVTKVKPDSGPSSGGTVVTITGTNFTGATGVVMGCCSSTGVFAVNPTGTSITVGSFAGTGVVNVRVFSPAGFSPIIAADTFTYL